MVPVDEDWVGPVDETDAVGRRRFDELSCHATKEDALSAMMLHDGLSYNFRFNYGLRGSSSIYRCGSHIYSHKYIRLVERVNPEDSHVISLQESGVHGTELSDVSKPGISILLKREVDTILGGGAGPTRCIRLLQESHRNNPSVLNLLPSLTQLKNRKAYLNKKGGGESLMLLNTANGVISLIIILLCRKSGHQYNGCAPGVGQRPDL